MKINISFKNLARRQFTDVKQKKHLLRKPVLPNSVKQKILKCFYNIILLFTDILWISSPYKQFINKMDQTVFSD